MHRLLGSFVLMLSAYLALVAVAPAAQFTVERNGNNVTINLDGKFFTAYVTDNGPKPILWPIIGPTGAEMTRAYPMKTVEGEKHDHYHHRSLWFTHMEVNGYNFWAEEQSFGKKNPEVTAKLAKTVHREFKEVSASGDRVAITAVNDWIGPKGDKVLEDERRLTFTADDTSRTIDFDIDLKATNGDVLFGDNKDGTFGIRVPTSMDVTSKQGGKITNSEGLTDEAAWGKAAKWCDYSGPVAGKTVGIAVLNHPSSFRYPTTWHVRTYGLFCANPFGWHDFKMDKDGSYTLKSGDTLKFRYRVILHSGDTAAANLPAAFDKYAAEKK
ncbi:MAG: PmoA family protein [Planctomycetaceae bacterium]|nr:PmoA family protein [Planctomycetaceae bacterium]